MIERIAPVGMLKYVSGESKRLESWYFASGNIRPQSTLRGVHHD